ncbi:MAG TPA: TolC family protein [Bacteroidales bacterium]|nr:TolC family protein [Bacteroidales bacterium]HOK73834.1 TolC family protein [Bacteroidales bacterium]HOM40090.1 TolC family protein [Bacteroidales bacterium]HOU30271.1 TolC family protein [Bacteroidales bacterium]HPP91725.1 TolC family protein [Bacteroidales bacterium]
MIVKRFISLVLLFSLISAGLYSQKKLWTLEECVRYALERNIQVKQQELQTRVQKNALDLAKLKLLPTLAGNATHNYSFGRALDETTYEFTEHENVRTNNFYIGGNLTIFSGLQNYHSIKKYRYELLASEEDLETIKNNIALSVAMGYLQILLNKELVNATESQLLITRQQIDKTRKLVEAGSVAVGNLLQIEAQAAQEELQLVNLKNQLELSYLSLAQLLELETPAGFEIIIPEISIDTGYIVTGTVEDIFQVACKNRPEILSSEMRLRSSEFDLKIAEGARSPRITMSHSFSTGYSDIRKKLLGIDPSTGPIYGKYTFADQIHDNVNYGIGFSLSLPILNGWQINKNISNSKLSIENSRYALDATRKQLYKNIQQAYADAQAALKKYTASIKAVQSAEESFRYSEQRFNVGLVTPVDYNAAKTQLLRAQSELAQSKYEFVFKIKVLDFYKGIPITLPQ